MQGFRERPSERIEVLNLAHRSRARPSCAVAVEAAICPRDTLLYGTQGALFRRSIRHPAASRCAASPFSRRVRRGRPRICSGRHRRHAHLRARVAGPRALRTVVWVDRQGREHGARRTTAPPDTIPLRPPLSPDGTRVLLYVAGPPNRDIWIWDVRRRALERFTLDPASNPPRPCGAPMEIADCIRERPVRGRPASSSQAGGQERGAAASAGIRSDSDAAHLHPRWPAPLL